MRTTFFPLILLALLLASPARAEVLDLDALVAEAMVNSPEIAALDAKTQAAWARVPQAGAMPDPMVGFGVQNVPIDSFAFDRDEMTSKMVELSQMFPFPGKRALKSEIAAREAEAVGRGTGERALMIRTEIKKVYYELYANRKAREVLEKNIELLETMRKVAEARYSVGTGMYKDIVKAQLETAMLLDRRIMLTREENTKRAYLASLLGRKEPVLGEVADIKPTAVADARDALAASAAADRPEIKAIEARIKRGEAMGKMARREFYPDFTISAQYMQRETLIDGMEPPDMVAMVVSVNLPVWRHSKLAPAVKEAGYEKTMAERELDAKMREIYYKIDSSLNEITQADRLLKLYKDITIPQANEDISAGLAGYEVGKGDFLSLIDSARVLLDYQTGYYNALAEREKAVAELEAAVGKELGARD